MRLTTGRRLNRYTWTTLPMPQDVIDRVHNLARRSYANKGLTFAWRNGKEILDTLHNITDNSDNEDDDNEDTDDHDDNTNDKDSFLHDESALDPLDLPVAGVVANINNHKCRQNDEELEHSDIQEPTNNTVEISDTEDGEKAGDKRKDNDSSAEVDNTKEHDETTAVDSSHTKEDDETTGVDSSHDAQIASSLKNEMDEKYGARKHGFGLLPRKKPNYGVKEAKPSDYDKTHPNLLTQYSIKKVLRIFGEKGADAVVKDMEQLDQRDVIEPKLADMLTRKGKKMRWNT